MIAISDYLESQGLLLLHGLIDETFLDGWVMLISALISGAEYIFLLLVCVGKWGKLCLQAFNGICCKMLI